MSSIAEKKDPVEEASEDLAANSFLPEVTVNTPTTLSQANQPEDEGHEDVSDDEAAMAADTESELDQAVEETNSHDASANLADVTLDEPAEAEVANASEALDESTETSNESADVASQDELENETNKAEQVAADYAPPQARAETNTSENDAPESDLIEDDVTESVGDAAPDTATATQDGSDGQLTEREIMEDRFNVRAFLPTKLDFTRENPPIAFGEEAKGTHIVMQKIMPDDWEDICANFTDADRATDGRSTSLPWAPHECDHLAFFRDGQLVSAARVMLFNLPFTKTGFAVSESLPLWQRGTGEDNPLALVSTLLALKYHYGNNQGYYLSLLPRSGTKLIRLEEEALKRTGYLKGSGLDDEEAEGKGKKSLRPGIFRSVSYHYAKGHKAKLVGSLVYRYNRVRGGLTRHVPGLKGKG